MGPLFYYELVRLARRGRSTLLRCAYVVAVYGALFYAYHQRFPAHDVMRAPFASPGFVGPADMARLAEGFVSSILWVQTLAIFALTPPYLSGAIVQEKEKRTLELLLTTHLTDREIVLGKLLARAAHLGGILLAGLPLLALTQLWGGVDFNLLLAAFLATGLNLLAVGAICVYCSTHSHTSTAALFSSYGLSVILLGTCLGPLATPVGVFGEVTRWRDMDLSRSNSFLVAVCVAVNGAVTFFGAGQAVRNLRPDELPVRNATYGPPPAPGSEPAADPMRPPAPEAPDLSRRLINLPPVGDRPLLWKETYCGAGEALSPDIDRSLLRQWPLTMLALVSAALPFWTIRWSSLPSQPGKDGAIELLNILQRLAVLIAAGVWCCGLAYRAAGTVSREREQRTLDGLLTLPVSRVTLLGAKWLGPALQARLAGYWLAGLVAVGLLDGLIHPLSALLVTLAVASHAAFLGSLGLWLSVTTRNTTRARVSLAVVLFVFFGLGLVRLVAEPDQNMFSRVPPAVSEAGANAPGAWWYLSFSWDEFAAARAGADAAFFPRLTAGVLGSFAYAGLAGVLWLSACWQFRGEG